MIWDIIFIVLLCIAISGLIYSFKHNVVLKKSEEAEKVFFYEDDERSSCQKPPLFNSDFKNLDAHISGTVRYNQSMYYDKAEFEKIKEDVLSKKLPM